MAYTGGSLTSVLPCARCSLRGSLTTRLPTAASKCTLTDPRCARHLPCNVQRGACHTTHNCSTAHPVASAAVTCTLVQTEAVRVETRRCSWCLGVCTFQLIEKNLMSRDRYRCGGLLRIRNRLRESAETLIRADGCTNVVACCFTIGCRHMARGADHCRLTTTQHAIRDAADTHAHARAHTHKHTHTHAHTHTHTVRCGAVRCGAVLAAT